MEVLGVDIGGSGIKGAPVGVADGALTRERLRIPTPQPADPEAVAEIIAQIVEHFGWTGPVGVTFPGVVKSGVLHTAANLGREWIGLDAGALFAMATGLSVTVLNDADAAGLAEMSHGSGKGRTGVVALVTLGTGIGSALFQDGRLLPNTELGHLEIRGKDAELRASGRVREVHDLSWEKWAKHVDEYLRRLEALISPELIIIGGGVSKKADRFVPLMKHVRTPVVPATLINNAGIVGAAMAASAAQPAPARRARPHATPAKPARAKTTAAATKATRTTPKATRPKTATPKATRQTNATPAKATRANTASAKAKTARTVRARTAPAPTKAARSEATGASAKAARTTSTSGNAATRPTRARSAASAKAAGTASRRVRSTASKSGSTSGARAGRRTAP